jgi:hypothetical protein
LGASPSLAVSVLRSRRRRCSTRASEHTARRRAARRHRPLFVRLTTCSSSSAVSSAVSRAGRQLGFDCTHARTLRSLAVGNCSVSHWAALKTHHPPSRASHLEPLEPLEPPQLRTAAPAYPHCSASPCLASLPSPVSLPLVPLQLVPCTTPSSSGGLHALSPLLSPPPGRCLRRGALNPSRREAAACAAASCSAPSTHVAPLPHRSPSAVIAMGVRSCAHCPRAALHRRSPW